MRTYVFMNPRSGNASQLALLKEEPRLCQDCILVETKSVAELREKARMAITGNCQLIVAAGGDGTVQILANVLIRESSKIPLGILPLGTGNDLCRTLAIPLSLKEAIGTLGKKRLRKVDAICVNSGDLPYVMNAVTGGWSGKVAAATSPEQKANWGPLAYLFAATSPLLGKTGYSITIRLDDGPPLQHEILNLVIANGRTAAGGYTIASHANPEDGLLNVVLIKNVGMYDLSVISARLMADDYDDDEYVVRYLAKRIDLHSDQVMPLSLDGEAVEGTDFRFQVSHRCVRMLVGSSYSADSRRAERATWTWLRSSRRKAYSMLATLLLFLVRAPRQIMMALVFAIVMTAIFGGIVIGLEHDYWQGIDNTTRRYVQEKMSPLIYDMAAFITHFGNGIITWSIGGVISLLMCARRRFIDAAVLLMILSGCVLIELTLKPLIGRERPTAIETLTSVTSYSFPSGHALRSVGLFGYLSYLALPRLRRSWFRMILSISFAGIGLLIAASRVVLDVHWLTDVIAGGVAAISWLAGCLAIRKYALQRKHRRGLAYNH